MIRRERLLNLLGLSLLAAAFGFSLWQVLRGHARERGDGVRVIRIAHWQLEAGAARAIDAAARDYEALHPGVRVEQLRIPERVYPNWVTTQLVGGTAPDLIQIGKGIDSERTARFFRPLTDEVQQPNPYNRGTPLEGLPWRETYFDGMLGGFDEALQDYYGAPLFTATVRMYVNATLLRQITGSAKPPADLEELLELCHQAEQWARRESRVLVPIAGSRYNAPILIDRVLRSTTQRLLREITVNRQLNADTDRVLLTLWRGDWGLDTPAMRAGLELAGRLGRHMQPGFLQLQRDDATFLFQQGRALMIATGSWDATSLMEGSPFEVRVFDLPSPSPAHPAYGRFILGRHSEASLRTYGPFGIPRSSPHPELALDFMRFITSAAQNQRFSDRSGWLPVIVGVRPPEAIAAFAPVADGFPDGFHLNLGPNTNRVQGNHLHRLFAAAGGVDDFIAQAGAPLRAAARDDLRLVLRNRLSQAARGDLVITAEEVLDDLGLADEGSSRRARGQRDRQFASEIHHAHLSAEMEALR